MIIKPNKISSYGRSQIVVHQEDLYAVTWDTYFGEEPFHHVPNGSNISISK